MTKHFPKSQEQSPVFNADFNGGNISCDIRKPACV